MVRALRSAAAVGSSVRSMRPAGLRAAFRSGPRRCAFSSGGAFFRPSIEGPRTMYDKIFDDHVVEGRLDRAPQQVVVVVVVVAGRRRRAARRRRRPRDRRRVVRRRVRVFVWGLSVWG